jgi:hypothetical protein
MALAGSPDPTCRVRKSNPGAILAGAQSPRWPYLGKYGSLNITAVNQSSLFLNSHQLLFYAVLSNY